MNKDQQIDYERGFEDYYRGHSKLAGGQNSYWYKKGWQDAEDANKAEMAGHDYQYSGE